MAGDSGWLSNRENFIAHCRAGTLPKLDLSGEKVSFDFSNLYLNGIDFSNCILSGSSFKAATLQECDFTGSDWSDCDFEHALLNGGKLGKIRNAHKALNLVTATANGFVTEFETAIRPWWKKLDWEVVGIVGKLPLFGVSTTALVALPFYFYLIGLYNHSLGVAKHSLASSLSNTPANPLAVAFSKLPGIPIPSLSLTALIAALLLAIGSTIYSLACPPLPRQFSLMQWRYELERSVLPYWSQAWSRQFARTVCVICYLVGGFLGVVVLGVKLYQTIEYLTSG
jgi:hypothetical protein